jgi:hypothetical protein
MEAIASIHSFVVRLEFVVICFQVTEKRSKIITPIHNTEAWAVPKVYQGDWNEQLGSKI